MGSLGIVFAAVSIGLMATPTARPWRRDILLGLRAALIEMPLRLVTGRRRRLMTPADYAALRKLEIECGLVEAPTVHDRTEELERLLADDERLRGVLARGEFAGVVREYMQLKGTRDDEMARAFRECMQADLKQFERDQASTGTVFGGVASYWTEGGEQS